jgi:ribosomal protein S12 methylthiotransferase accessory factor
VTKPVFKPHLRVSVIPGEGVLVLSEDKAWALRGNVYQLLAPLIDGSRNADELVDAVAGNVDMATAYYALALLEKNGYITESVPRMPKETAAFWHGMGIEPSTAIQALKASRVRVRAVGEMDSARLCRALANFGMSVTEEENVDVDFEAVVTDDYLRLELDALNAASLQAGRPWLLVKPVGHEPWVGPLFIPYKTGCHTCLTRQLARNRPVHRFVTEKTKLSEPPYIPIAATEATLSAVCQLAAVEVAKFIAGAKEGLEGRVLSLDVRTWNTMSHSLLRHPNCVACGKEESAKAMPLELVNRKAIFIQDCGHRASSPEETLAKYQHLVSPITGVVTKLEPVQKAADLIHVYTAGHNPALKIESLDFLKASLRNRSSGKGTSETQAKASALCEAIERYSGVRNGTEITVTGSFREMRERFGGDAIHPNEVMRYSNRQLEGHEAWNKRKSKFNVVPEALDESVPIDWTPVWSLTHARHKYLPTQLLYYQSKASADCDTFYSMGCSNGNASGNNLEEAVLQGFCELVERDAVALWWYNRLRKPGVAVASFEEPYLLELIKHYKTLDREAWALDITSDLGIPAFAAVSRLSMGPEEHIFVGLGCHLDARVALQRAFAELTQMVVLAKGREDIDVAIADDETLSWLRTATLANQPYLAPDATIAPNRRQDYPTVHSGDLLEDIQLCRRIVEERGMKYLCSTRPGLR